MRLIYVVEPIWTGVKHSKFNSAFIQLLRKCYTREEIHFFAESNHLDRIKAELGTETKDYSFTRIYLPKQNKKYKIPFLYLASLFQSIRMLLKLPKNALLIFSAMNSLVLGPLYLINLLINRQVIIVAHGELAFLDIEVTRKLNLHYSIQAFIFRSVFKYVLASRNIYFIVLGEFISTTLKKYIHPQLLERKTLIMEHPYVFSSHYTKERKQTGDKLRLAIVGLATKAKGSHNIVNLFEALQARGIQSEVELSIIGKVVDFDEELKNTEIKFYSKSSFLDQDTYNKLIDEQDFILFFYPNNTYKLTASGAFLDCLLHNKPIISLKNSYFSYYSNKIGRIGYSVVSVEDMAERVKCLIERYDQEGKEDFEFERFRLFFSPKTIARSFNRELSSKGFLDNK